jgi:stage IV sporulation protein FB
LTVLLSEPQRTAYDLQFSVGGIPIRVHPLFWVIAALPALPTSHWVDILLAIVVVFFSIVVHEMGHALAFRYFGWHSHIVLYSFGGLAIPDASYGHRVQTHKSRMIISLAGPVAGFLLAGIIVLTLFVLDYRVDFRSQFSFLNFDAGRGDRISNPNAAWLVEELLFVNILWGLINLLPVFPLDGGQFFREVLLLFNPRDGVRQSLLLSIGTAIAMAAFSYVRMRSEYSALLFGYLAYMSYSALQSLGDSGGRNW